MSLLDLPRDMLKEIMMVQPGTYYVLGQCNKFLNLLCVEIRERAFEKFRIHQCYDCGSYEVFLIGTPNGNSSSLKYVCAKGCKFQCPDKHWNIIKDLANTKCCECDLYLKFRHKPSDKHGTLQDFVKYLPEGKTSDMLFVDDGEYVWSLSTTFNKYGHICEIIRPCGQEENVNCGYHHVIGASTNVIYDASADTIIKDALMVDKYGDRGDQYFSSFMTNIFEVTA